MSPQIHVAHLSKHYQVHEKEPGLMGSLRAFVARKYRTVRAVDDVSFDIEAGEMIGFLGPNGAGKTTTLKVLSGLLYPTSGIVTVLGFTPHKREPAYLKQFTLVMGQKQQLLWDLPAIETFLVNQAIYEIPRDQFAATLKELDQLLDLGPLLKKQVRKLSLGERMKCELAAALLHRPKVLFLDEPTIGLDVTMQVRIRDFIAEYNRRYGATVILTSHYMADVTALCDRIIVIDKGKVLYDGNFRALIERVAPYKILKLQFEQPVACEQLAAFGAIASCDGMTAVLHVPRSQAAEAAARLLTQVEVDDVNFEDPPVEDIIREVFTGKVTGLGTANERTPAVNPASAG
ncbi:MAG: ATP-binding cassette domain-containing protein [Chloroflexi bacterium]|uniref:ABC transporter n=1 Tax=Candidatus Thermofonsia Clade 3 bacterium TaxID=2364212 RepID=A0A2M8QAU9_9CHLR|nr:ATP-binding cassette domain-containing protein [Candidatus Roseilinea sp. NK_OTU-006]PJF46909.1 MAG: ABC transporter [Candidatus Thermofonsia Clade 3 bacterium]RMG64796.1 MAG: ATP-binding cassette domain-containing protein [Chloroflexota bacterium]